eukprot:15134058-Heterocapsa_arctica.AAC.1
MNNTFCSSYTRKRWTNTDSDHSDCDGDNNYPGHRVRKEASDRMVENHKDKIFQEREETKPIGCATIGNWSAQKTNNNWTNCANLYMREYCNIKSRK